MCEDVRLVSVASGTVENAMAAASEFGIGHFTADWRETVEREDVDLVCITTPPNLHREMTVGSLANGKNVLCEKPMAMNAAEAEEMCRAAKESGRLALIDFELRFQLGRQAAFRIIRDGAIGKVLHAKWNFRAPHRGDIDLPWNWWSDAEQGGGALGAIGSHVVDSLHWLLGTNVSSIYCQLQSQIKKRPFDEGLREVTSDDETLMVLRFSDSELTEDATGIVSLSMVEPPTYENRLEIFGTKAAMLIDHRGAAFIADNKSDAWEQVKVPLGRNLPGMPDTGFPRGFLEFAPKILEAIREGKASFEHAPTFEDGLKTQLVLDAARESNRLRCAIDLNA